MKKIAFIFSLLFSILGQAQILGYEGLGILLTDENPHTTARTMSMKNAFGALGGDLSAIAINPAGAAVYNYSVASISFGKNNTDIQSSFYGTDTTLSNTHVSLSQVGGLILFNDYFDKEYESNWKKVTASVNMNTVYDFDGKWIAKGLTTPTWTSSNESIEYTKVDSQKYSNFTKGSHKVINFSLAAQYSNSLYIGASFNTHEMDYTEDAKREEVSSDNSGNYVDAFESYWQEINGEGYSFSAGVIFKPIQSIRLGFSYTSPTWYEISEESNMYEEDINDVVGYYDVIYSDEGVTYENNIDKVQAYDYLLRTPSKTTASAAFVFGKMGLVSADLTSKNYKGIDFIDSSEVLNTTLNNNLQNTYHLKLGTEWRFKQMSFRGGYSYEQTPYVDSIETDNIKGYALGFGYDFGDYVFDIAYDYKENTDFRNIYPDLSELEGVEMLKNNNKVIATLVIKL